MKRRYTVDSDDDEYRENEEHIKRSRTQQQRPTVDSADEDGEEEVEVDVEDTADDRSQSAAPSTSRKGPSRPAKPKPRDAQPVQKKRRLPVASEPDTEDEYVDRGGDEDEDFAAEPERERPVKGKEKAMGRIPRHAKGKATEKRPRAKLKGEEESTGEPVVTPDAPSVNLTHSPPSAKEEAPPPKKRKLPTIKKNKSAASTSSTTTTVAKAAPPSAPKAGSGILEGSILPLPTTATRKPAALAGQTDFDLRNQDVYNLLFKHTGGSTPRSGLSRREKNEERQRELNKMREEAKAKRELEAVWVTVLLFLLCLMGGCRNNRLISKARRRRWLDSKSG
ncbi:hypothetical protein AX14_000181 [Amanita brunnescens Koide BX004]|nr:hypothetical protein AX14_000181 [Amanita brunnescens Koide BX004]